METPVPLLPVSKSPEIRGSEGSILLLRRSNHSYPAESRSRSSTTSVFLNFINNGSKSNVSAKKHTNGRLISLFRLLILELNLPGPQSSKQSSGSEAEDEKRAYEQLVNMVKVPFYLEKFIAFGLLVCLNSFLTLLTLVPLKICIISYSALYELVADYRTKRAWNFGIFTKKLHFVKRDVITLFLILSTVAILASPTVEVSRLYHDVRGQAHIKLYVMFGVLEVADKLLSSIGQEISTVLVGIAVTNTDPKNLSKLFLFTCISLIYLACHSYVLIYQSVSLHVAANSYSNALMALLLSNQFAELKGSVFKKFEREGLFQVTMSDLTERFQLSMMLFIIALRNFSQLSSTQLGLVPNSWQSWNKWFGAIFGPSVVVLGSEIFVDWLKHCFINKFNRIRPRVYDNFLYVLSLDFMEVFTSNSKDSPLHEASDYVILTKRIGLPIMSLSICFLRMTLRDLSNIFLPTTFSVLNILASSILLLLTFVTLLVVRLILGLWLLKWARQIKHNHEGYQKKLRESKILRLFVQPEYAVPEEYSPQEKYVISEDELVMEETKVRTFTTGTDDVTPEPTPNLPLSRRAFSSLPRGPVLPELDLSFTTAHDFNNILDDASSGEIHKRSTAQSDTEIESSFIPGVPNTESSSINPTTRSYLYDYGETVPPTPEEKRNAQVKKKRFDSPSTDKDPWDDALGSVQRYEMSSKRIW